ncbi:MAG: hypothetical protein ACN6OP_19620 [Pseudomonadales bacterium]
MSSLYREEDGGYAMYISGLGRIFVDQPKLERPEIVLDIEGLPPVQINPSTAHQLSLMFAHIARNTG